MKTNGKHVLTNTPRNVKQVHNHTNTSMRDIFMVIAMAASKITKGYTDRHR